MPEDDINDRISEREPLLAKSTSIPQNVESGASGTGPLPSGLEDEVHSNGAIKATQQGDDPERPRADDAREAQFKGMPEVKKQMKYILPALSIGVSQLLAYALWASLRMLDIPRCRGSNDSGCFLREDG